jgi:hypothetical protein
MRLDLALVRAARAEPVCVDVERVIVAGFTGRDRAAVERHLAELRAHGVPCPDRTPVLYQKFARLLTTAGAVEVLGPDTSGEAEFVLLAGRDRVLVAAASDHTDRELEKTSIEKSKLVCPGVLSPEVWDLADVRGHWDELVIRSHVTRQGRRLLYQEGRLDAMLHPDDLLRLVRERLRGDLAGAAVFSGTLAAVGGELVCGERFEVELHDPRLRRRLTCDYRVTPVDWVTD